MLLSPPRNPAAHYKHLAKTPDNKFSCGIDGCSKTFKHSFILYRHQREKHGAAYIRPYAARAHRQEHVLALAALNSGVPDTGTEGAVTASGQQWLKRAIYTLGGVRHRGEAATATSYDGVHDREQEPREDDDEEEEANEQPEHIEQQNQGLQGGHWMMKEERDSDEGQPVESSEQQERSNEPSPERAEDNNQRNAGLPRFNGNRSAAGLERLDDNQSTSGLDRFMGAVGGDDESLVSIDLLCSDGDVP